MSGFGDYDRWKLATPPEYDITAEEEHKLEIDQAEEEVGELADLLDSAFDYAKARRGDADERELWLFMAHIVRAALIDAELKGGWRAEVERYAPRPSCGNQHLISTAGDR